MSCCKGANDRSNEAGADVVDGMPANENTPDDSWAYAYALAAYDDHYDAYVIEKLAKARMRIITNPPTNLMLEGNIREAIRLDSDRLYVIRKGKVAVKTKTDVSLMI